MTITINFKKQGGQVVRGTVTGRMGNSKLLIAYTIASGEARERWLAKSRYDLDSLEGGSLDSVPRYKTVRCPGVTFEQPLLQADIPVCPLCGERHKGTGVVKTLVPWKEGDSRFYPQQVDGVTMRLEFRYQGYGSRSSIVRLDEPVAQPAPEAAPEPVQEPAQEQPPVQARDYRHYAGFRHQMRHPKGGVLVMYDQTETDLEPIMRYAVIWEDCPFDQGNGVVGPPMPTQKEARAFMRHEAICAQVGVQDYCWAGEQGDFFSDGTPCED